MCGISLCSNERQLAQRKVAPTLAITTLAITVVAGKLKLVIQCDGAIEHGVS